MTALIYLNEDYEGGETAFIRTGLKVKGKTRDVILFRNDGADTGPNSGAVYVGLPVTGGISFVDPLDLRGAVDLSFANHAAGSGTIALTGICAGPLSRSTASVTAKVIAAGGKVDQITPPSAHRKTIAPVSSLSADHNRTPCHDWAQHAHTVEGWKVITPEIRSNESTDRPHSGIR